MTKHFCDKCHKEISEVGGVREVVIPGYGLYLKTTEGVTHWTCVQLCLNCCDDFREMFRNWIEAAHPD